jgi:hypothetical protein
MQSIGRPLVELGLKAASLVDFFSGDSDIGGSRSIVLLWNISDCSDFTALLRRVVFVGETALGLRFDLERVWHLNSSRVK